MFHISERICFLSNALLLHAWLAWLQVGHMQTDHDYWGRPEDMEAAGVPRPSYVINATRPGSDMAAQAAAALAAAARVSPPRWCKRAAHCHFPLSFAAATVAQADAWSSSSLDLPQRQRYHQAAHQSSTSASYCILQMLQSPVQMAVAPWPYWLFMLCRSKPIVLSLGLRV